MHRTHFRGEMLKMQNFSLKTNESEEEQIEALQLVLESLYDDLILLLPILDSVLFGKHRGYLILQHTLRPIAYLSLGR